MDIDVKHSLYCFFFFFFSSFGSLILHSVMSRAAMYLRSSIPSYSGQPAKRSYPEVMTIDGDIYVKILALNTP